MKIENFWERVLIEVASNSIKSLLIIFLSVLLVVLAAIYNPLVEVVNKYVPKTILLILPLILIPLLLISLLYIVYLHKKLKVELKKALGVYWDKDLNPYCPSCKKYLGNYADYETDNYYFRPGFMCINCKNIIRLSDSEKIFMNIDEAKEKIKNLFNKK